MKALVLDAENRTGVMRDILRPALGDHDLLIYVRAVALNPVDALYARYPIAKTGRVIGSDFAGVVAEVGSLVKASSGIVTGSRVAGFLQGATSYNARPGAFAEYLACPWQLVWQIGELAFEQAATVSLCGLTAAQALYIRLGVPAPFEISMRSLPTNRHTQGPVTVLINGASTSVGLYAAQLLNASPIDVRLFGTASPKHAQNLSATPYSYHSLLDRSSDWVAGIMAATSGQGVDFVFDCISEGSSVVDSFKCLGKAKAADSSRLAVVRSQQGNAWSYPSEDAFGTDEPAYGAVWEGLGAEVEYAGMTLSANEDMRAFTTAFYNWLSNNPTSIQPNKVRLMPGGLQSIVDEGFVLLGASTMEERALSAIDDRAWMQPISGEKLVYSIGN